MPTPLGPALVAAIFLSLHWLLTGVGAPGELRFSESLCQEDAKAFCCTEDEGGPFGAAL
jgi:hypothetical protein